jgi:ZIP family zinc transporter
VILSNLIYILVPIAAALIGASASILLRPKPSVISAIQHFAAGVVFAAAAGEILPDLLHQNAVWPTAIGGAIGVALMSVVKKMEEKATGASAFLTAIGIDLFIDGLVLGIGFVAGVKAGLLLTFALGIEILFLGFTVAVKLKKGGGTSGRVLGIMAALALLLPLGASFSIPIGMMPAPILTGCFAFGLIALLYLVTEELLVDAHEKTDSPLITAMFFVGFLLLLLVEQGTGSQPNYELSNVING